MKIFGIEVEVKKTLCSLNGKAPVKITEPYVNVYVRMTNHCNANCAFCDFKNNACKKNFDFYKFYYMLIELRKQVKINKISFTGGEPTLCINTMVKCLELVRIVDKTIFTVVNTNGFNLEYLDKPEYLNLIDSICLSRHEIKDLEVYLAFNCVIKTSKDLNEMSKEMKKKIHLSCNLIKGRIDGFVKAHDFIDFYSGLGFHDFGFVSLMPVNQFCKDNFIDFDQAELWKMKNTIKTKDFAYGTGCKCNNFLTTSDKGVINKVYARYYCDHTRSDSTLVYDIDCLKIGFQGAILL